MCCTEDDGNALVMVFLTFTGPFETFTFEQPGDTSLDLLILVSFLSLFVSSSGSFLEPVRIERMICSFDSLGLAELLAVLVDLFPLSAGVFKTFGGLVNKWLLEGSGSEIIQLLLLARKHLVVLRVQALRAISRNLFAH